MFELPLEITVNGKRFGIRNKGDFRMVLDCFVALEDNELDKTERILSSLIIFYDGMNELEDLTDAFGSDLSEAVSKMFNFFNCGEKEIGNQTNHKLVNWEQDEQLISSAINNVAGKEIRFEPYIHWWTFMGYFLAIGESPLSTVIGIRHKIKTNKKLEKEEKEFKRNNPQYFIWDSQTIEQKEAEELVRQIWNNKEGG